MPTFPTFFAGMMSRTTLIIKVAGNLIRIYTTLVLTQDVLLLTANVTRVRFFHSRVRPILSSEYFELFLSL